MAGLGLICFTSVALAKEATVVGLGDNREAAIDDAKRNAVEQIVGTMIDSRSMSEMAVVKLDEIYTKSRGFVKKITVLEEGPAGGAYRVKALIDVDTNSDAKLMDQLTMLMMLNDPRIAVVIRQRPEGNGMSGTRYADLCQTIIYEKLLSEGFSHLVDYDTFQSGREPMNESGLGIDQSDSAIDQSGLATDQGDLAMGQNDLATDQDNLVVDQSGLATDQGDLAADQSDSAIGQNDLAIDQSGVAVDQGGLTMNQNDLAMGQSDLTMNQSDLAIGQSGLAMNQNDFVIDQSDSAMDQNGFATDQSDLTIDQNGSAIGEISSAVDYLVMGQLSIRAAPIVLPKYSDYTSETSGTPSVQTGLHKVSANMDAKIIKTDTHETIGEFHTAGESIGSNETDAKYKAVANLAAQAAEAVKKSFARKGADVNGSIRLLVRASGQTELLRLEEALRSLSGVRRVILRGYENGKGTFDVDTDMKPGQIYRRLREAGCDLFMEKSSANTLEVSL